MKLGTKSRWLTLERNPIDTRVCTVTLVAEDLVAKLDMVDFDLVTPDRGDLVGFLSGLAKDWKGWKGQRIFATTESEFKISASHDGLGHTRFTVELKHYAWSVTAEIDDIELSDLENYASSAQALFST
jgi:hypothetical protein